MVEYDRAVGEAMAEADRLTAEALRRDPDARPIAPILPHIPVQADGKRLAVPPVQLVTPPAAGPQSRASCTGNCYQTDSTLITQNLPAGTYAFDYMMWMGTPQTNQSNRCDGSSGTGCFWFQAAQYNMDAAGAGFHVGPQRGASFFGDSEDDWHLSHSGYNAANSGLPTGAVCTTTAPTHCVDDEIPMGTWVRIRVWRLSTSYNPTWGNMSKWGSWAQWGGVDHQIGTNLWMRGTTLVWANQFVEIYEESNQCITDFERTYFNNPTSLSTSQGWTVQPDADANYQNNCSNTTWERLGGEFIRNEREHNRVIGQGGFLW